MGILFFWELACAIVILIYGIEESPVLIEQLNQVLLELVYNWDIDPRASRILRQIMEYVGCCGADGSDDFIKAHKPVPFECRDPVTGAEYPFGCRQQLAWWLEPWTCVLAAFCLFFCLAEIAGVFSVRRLRKMLKVVREQHEEEKY